MIYIISIIAAILFMLFIIFLVRNKKLNEKYSILWMIFGIMIILLAINYKLLDVVAVKIGIYYAPALLFLTGFIFLIIYTVHLSIVATKQNRDIIRLNQEIAIINEKIAETEAVSEYTDQQIQLANNDINSVKNKTKIYFSNI